MEPRSDAGQRQTALRAGISPATMRRGRDGSIAGMTTEEERRKEAARDYGWDYGAPSVCDIDKAHVAGQLHAEAQTVVRVVAWLRRKADECQREAEGSPRRQALIEIMHSTREWADAIDEGAHLTTPQPVK